MKSLALAFSLLIPLFCFTQNSDFVFHFYDSPNGKGSWADEPGARECIEALESELELLFSSPVSIEIEVRLVSFSKMQVKNGDDLLAKTTVRRWVLSSRFDHGGDSRVYDSCRYPYCLAEKFHGSPLQPGVNNGAEIWFNVDKNFSYNTSEPFVAVKHQLYTTAMHEVFHYMGFWSHLEDRDEYQSIKKWGNRPLDFELRSPNLPTFSKIFGDYGVYKFVTSEAVRYWGFGARNAYGALSGDYGGVPMYAPSEFLQGKSIDHFNDGIFDLADNDILMEPYTIKGKFVDLPGQVTLKLLERLGWDYQLGINEDNNREWFKIYPNPVCVNSTVSFNDEINSPAVKVSFISIDGRLIKTLNIQNNGNSFSIPPLSEGMYFVQIDFENVSSKSAKIILQ